MKILLEETTSIYKEVDINIPFYSYVQEDDKEIFVKIDEKYFYQISLSLFCNIEVFRSQNHGYIAEIWYKNKSNEEGWEWAIQELDKFIKQLN